MTSDRSHEVPEAKEEHQPGRKMLWGLLAGVSLVSFSLLAFEITLTRILSVVLSYHYVFIVISLALLGLGAGGIFVHLIGSRISRGYTRFDFIVLFAALFSLLVPLSVIAMSRLTYMAGLSSNIFLYLLLLFVPFFCAGAFLAEVFRAFPALSSRLYGMDLVGAAAGSLGIVLILNSLGGIRSALLLALVAVTGAFLIAMTLPERNPRRVVTSIVSVVLVLALSGTSLIGLYKTDISIGSDPGKEIHHVLNEASVGGKIAETRWSAFGRTDLVSLGNNPNIMTLYLDGTAGTPMFRFNGDLDRPDPQVEQLKTTFTGYVPFYSLQDREKDNALIIGPGGGRDVLLALMGGVRQITAVEVNRDLVDIVKEYSEFNGGIYTDFKNVSLVIDEGRNFLKRQTGQYDIIMLSLPIIKTSRSLEGYALTENFLFTTESINDYLDHLTDEGRLIVVSHDPIEVLRLVSNSLTALNQRGISNRIAMEQIYVVGASMYPAFVMKKTPFAPGEMLPVHQTVHQLGYDATWSYLPSIKQGSCTPHEEEVRYDECAMLSPVFTAIGRAQLGLVNIERLAGQDGYDISAVSDNSPFFYKFKKGIPLPVSIVLWSSAAILLLVTLLPALFRRRSTVQKSAKALKFSLLFSMLGIGFMLVEISAIQRFILFLGQPVLSLAVLLFSLLVGAGLGSIYSGRFRPERMVRVLTIVSLTIVALLLIYSLLLPFILEQLLGLDLAIRLLTTVVMLVPLGLLMGFPFPLTVRLLKEMKMENHIPWMWGINGIASVVGSALTVAIAIAFGFTQALLVGALCYLIVFLIGFQLRKSLA